MEKIKLSNLNKIEKYRAIIPVFNSDNGEYVYVLNPNTENMQPIMDYFNSVWNGDLEENEDVAYKILIDNFTNIEVDDKINFDTKDIVLSEVLFHLTIIFNQCLNICILANINGILEDSRDKAEKELNRLANDLEKSEEKKE
ncbi:Uncharacterised protein [Peptostreptococcus anaerobius]|uniref:Uncharacterized protein n=1 Tax=Peptostreptococcus anaerobius TaxID=1261 RepID=A0A379DK88_9FIRM|nr:MULTISPECIES: hypothetical protein [Peptostreptococcus]MDU5350028.1 hypothetical protein [Peptostreptococcus sp.]MDU5891518.1 hypothetical protein [Peptostreptococcus sp.]SFM86928.1 hypothetical protein SAMN05660467_00645 [Peptostreptococcus anaerobius]SUB60160.1 Uncharacterised protein [Peptostreptococcus anaerobius]SUB62149.1 Uncharacterised protein [Peptostreptococcus anaerobius]